MEYRPFPSLQRRNLTQEMLEVPVLVKAMKLPRSVRILEVGCGRGIAFPPLDRLCTPTRLVGIDVDAEALSDAEQHLRQREVDATVVLGDVRSMPFVDGEFDVVIDFGTCYHIARPGDALEEISRVLQPGGVFVYETRASQLLSHPIRSFGKSLPWRAIKSLKRIRRRLLWASRVKLATA